MDRGGSNSLSLSEQPERSCPLAEPECHENIAEMENESAANGSTVNGASAGQGFEPVEDLGERLGQLQGLVEDMKVGFSQVMSALHEIRHGDQMLQQRVSKNKAEYDQKMSDVVNMVLSLQNEFGNVVGQLQAANESQRALENQMEYLQFERDVLMEDLQTAGAITESARKRYDKGKLRPTVSGSSTDSSCLSALLEKAHSSTQNTSSDQDSGLASSHPPDGGESSPNSTTSRTPHYSPRGTTYPTIPEGCNEVVIDGYESDSSVTQAANHSLDLSRSLEAHCLEGEDADLSSDEGNKSDREEDSEKVHNQAILLDPQVSSSPRLTKSGTKKPGPRDMTHRQVQRSRVAMEILETERKYCSNLWIILEHFATPLKQGTIISIKEVSLMFPASLSHIYERHCQLLQLLEERLTSWKYHGLLGDIFARFVDANNSQLLTQYQTYVRDFPVALRLIKKMCRQSRAFRKYLKRRLQDPMCESLDIAAFMLTPVQRVPRYVLLLKQLLKYTDANHPDYYHIESSLHKLGSFLNQLNDSIQHSMHNVASNTPKTKRKLGRSFSLRSTSSCDEEMMTSTSRGGFFSNVNTSLFNRAGRIPVLDASKRQPENPHITTGNHSFLLPNKPVVTSRRPASDTFNTSSSKTAKLRQRDRTFKGLDSFTLPSRAEKRRKTKSRETIPTLSEPVTTLPGAVIPGFKITESMSGMDHSYAQKPPLPRSRSAAEPVLSADSHSLSTTLSGSAVVAGNYVPSWNRCRSQESVSSTGDAHDTSAAQDGTSSTNISGYSISHLDWPRSQNLLSNQFQSMPKLALESYGIFGDNDEPSDSSAIDASLMNNSIGSRYSWLHNDSRSRVRTSIDLPDGRSWSPSQGEINASLAHSLIDTDNSISSDGRGSFRKPCPPKIASSTPFGPKPHTLSKSNFELNSSIHTNILPKSNAINMSISSTGSTDKSTLSKCNERNLSMMDQSANDSVNVTMNKGKGRWEWRRKGKDKSKKSIADASFLSLDKKASNLKQSLKNIFLRRKGKVSESFMDYTDASMAQVPDENVQPKPAASMQSPPRGFDSVRSSNHDPTCCASPHAPTRGLYSTEQAKAPLSHINRDCQQVEAQSQIRGSLSHFIVTGKKGSSEALQAAGVSVDADAEEVSAV